MLYAVLCYNSEEVVFSWSKEEDAAVMSRLGEVQKRWESKLKPSLRLLPTSAATSFHKETNLVIDGPFVETKEQLLGFYIVDCATLEEAIETARAIKGDEMDGGFEIRPLRLFQANAQQT